MAGTVEVVVGRVVKAHGVRGDVVVESHTDEPALRFATGTTLGVEHAPRQLVVRSARHSGGRLVVGFSGIDTRNDAEALVGTTLVATVPADATPHDESEYYDRHLVGLAVCKPDGTQVGVVDDVLHGPAQDVLAVATPAGQRLVPFVAALVPAVDIDGRRLTVADIPGLLEDE